MSTRQESNHNDELQEPAGNLAGHTGADPGEDTAGNPALARAAAHVHNTAQGSANDSVSSAETSSTLGDGGGMSGGSVLDSGPGG